jgi:hypothetical protein
MHIPDSIKVRVKWENGWLSDYKHHELELVKARRESAPPRRPKTKPRRAASRHSNGEK